MQVNICGDSVYGFSLFLVLCLWLFALFCAETLSLLLALICSVLNGVLTLHSWVGCAPGTAASVLQQHSELWAYAESWDLLWQTSGNQFIKLSSLHMLQGRSMTWCHVNYHEIWNDIHTRMHVMFWWTSYNEDCSYPKGEDWPYVVRGCGANAPLVVSYNQVGHLYVPLAFITVFVVPYREIT